MSCYFDVTLKNFAKYFLHEEREHTEKLARLQHQLGVQISLQDIKSPQYDDRGNTLKKKYTQHLGKYENQSHGTAYRSN